MCFSRFHTSVLQQQANYARNYIQVEVQDAAASTALDVSTSSGTSTWEFWSDLGLENTYTTNSSNHTWTGTTDKKVRFFPPSGDWALVAGTLAWNGKQLKGPIDPNFGKLENILQLRLYNNSLTGSIPDFTNLPNLQQLHLYNNSLTGSIPDFTNLPNLQYLYLQGNSLTGGIPDIGTNHPALITCRLQNNQLSGLDTPWSISATTTEFRADGNALTTAAHINEILVRADAAGAVNGLLNVSGGTNAAPDGSSGGFDGLTARANLIGKGWTVTTN